MDLRLWSLKPHENVINVYPQNWFNRGAYDFGYQWVTRVARDPSTGKIIGDGIRIRPFVLDDTFENIAAWL